MTTTKKGLAVHNSSAELVHKLMDDGEAQIGKTGSDVNLKGNIYVDSYSTDDTLATILTNMGGDAGGISDALDIETGLREDGDISLTTRVSTAEDTSEANRTSLQTRISTAEDTSEDNRASLQTRVSTAEDTSEDNRASLQTRVSTAEVTSEDNRSSLSARILAEETARGAADTILTTAINTEKDRVDAILLGADADLDNFAAVVQLVNDVDTENDQAFGAHVIAYNEAKSSLNTRVSDAEDEEAANELSINARLDVIDGAGGSDESLTARISDLEVLHDEEEASMTTRISTAEVTSEDNRASLQTRISTAEDTSETNRGSLQTRISTAEDTSETNRSSLATAITTEKDRVDAILLGADADLDNFAAVVQLVNDIDVENDDLFAAFKNNYDNTDLPSLNTRISDAEDEEAANELSINARLDVIDGAGGSDESLTARISDLEVLHDEEEASMTTRISDAEDTSEANRGSLQTRISDAEDTSEANRGSLQTRISDAEDTSEANRASLQTRVSDAEDTSEANRASLTTRVTAMATDGGSMNLSGLAEVGSLKSSGTVQVGTLEAADLTPYLSGDQSSYDGMMFYFKGSGVDLATGAAAPFADPNKWYFCEAGEWYPSPFFTEEE